MSAIPPAPPPPPPPLELGSPPVTPQPSCTNKSPFTYVNYVKWDTQHPELWEACAKYNIDVDEVPYKCTYRSFDPILQLGPTCGLVALSMIINGEVTADEILSIAKQEGYTCHGEMFSCKNLLKLSEKVLSLAEIENITCGLGVGGLFSDEIIEKLINGAALLVPYDADCNHSPCLRKGHTAHWALVCGVMIRTPPDLSYTSNPSNILIFARHGKSKYLAIWRLDELQKSNKNLLEFSPKKESDGLTYVLPEGGIGGQNGLRDQFLIFEGFKEN